MKRGFTLVELLVVVVVIVTLMAIAFRISGAGDDIGNRAKTVNRMQRIENCLSGYYAAYGSYPPVALHGRRDYRYGVNSSGIQKLDDYADLSFGNDEQRDESWRKVQAACRSQPLCFECPYRPPEQGKVQAIAASCNMTFDALVEDSQVHGKETETDWLRAQICKLGVMSYLLPRLLVMLDDDNGDDRFLELLDCAQWSSNNEKPCDFASGQTYGSWKEAKAKNEDLFKADNRWKIALLPSQAMCARWIANLEGIVACPQLTLKPYGVDINDSDESTLVPMDGGGIFPYTASGAQGADPGSGGGNYVLKRFTVKDGWGQELYYYSLPPYQSYTLWSSGPNQKTFPPWISDDDLGNLDPTVQEWISDDIVHMKN